MVYYGVGRVIKKKKQHDKSDSVSKFAYYMFYGKHKHKHKHTHRYRHDSYTE